MAIRHNVLANLHPLNSTPNKKNKPNTTCKIIHKNIHILSLIHHQPNPLHDACIHNPYITTTYRQSNIDIVQFLSIFHNLLACATHRPDPTKPTVHYNLISILHNYDNNLVTILNSNRHYPDSPTNITPPRNTRHHWSICTN